MPAHGQTPPPGFAVALDMHATCSGVWRPACRTLPPARAHPTARSPCLGSVQFHWNKEWTTLEKHNYDRSKGKVSIEWFLGGETNLCYNALDRHVANGKGSQVAFHWEGNDVGETRDITYQEMLDEVCRIANVLVSFGVKRGEPVAIYLPMIPELPAAMLACARIGAIHSVIFGGFSAESLASRILDAKCRVVIAADGVMRGPKLVPLLQITNDALAMCGKEGHAVEHVLCVQRLSDAASPIKTGQITLGSVHKLWSETVCKVLHNLSEPQINLYRPQINLNQPLSTSINLISTSIKGQTRLPSGVDGCGGSTIHAVHQRVDREAKGSRAYYCGVHGVGSDHVQVHLRLQAR